MNNREDLFTLLTRYAAGDLPPAEAEVVTRRLAEDTDYAAVWAEVQLLQQGLAAYGRAQTRARIRDIVQSQPIAAVRPLWQRPAVWGSAIAVAAALALLFWAVPWTGRSEPRLLSSRGEEAPPAAAPDSEAIPAQEAPSLTDLAQHVLRQPLPGWDAGASRQAVPTPGLRAFQDQDDAAVIRILTDGQARNANSPLQQFMLGVSYLRTGELAQGQAILSRPVIRERFPEETAWYLALATLLQGQTEPARRALEQIDAQQPPHPQREQARELLSHFPPLEFGE